MIRFARCGLLALAFTGHAANGYGCSLFGAKRTFNLGVGGPGFPCWDWVLGTFLTEFAFVCQCLKDHPAREHLNRPHKRVGGFAFSLSASSLAL